MNEVSDSISVKPAKDGKCLSFFLAIKEDFDFFHAGATIKLLKTEWTVGSPENDLDEPEVDE